MFLRPCVLAVACFALSLLSHRVDAALVLQQDAGTVYETTAFGNSDTTSADMAGMEVTVEFANSTTQTANWTAAGASGTGWSLTQGPGSTFSNDWTLTNTALLGSSIRRLTINGRPGDTVFDRATAMSTVGSDTGTEFSETTLLGLVSLLQDVTVTYQDAVALTDDPVVGDVWSVLDIEFSSGLGGLQSFSFIQDTDNIMIPGDFAAVSTPEPASLALMGLAGLIAGSGCMASRRRRKPSPTATYIGTA